MKIKTSDLRIGNYVTTSFTQNQIFVVSAIYAHSVDIQSINDKGVSLITFIDSIIPIFITNEYLLSMGFWQSKHGYFERQPVTRVNIELSTRGKEWIIFSGVEPDSETPNVIAIIENLHQLQNWWSACNLGNLTLTTPS